MLRDEVAKVMDEQRKAAVESFNREADRLELDLADTVDGRPAPADATLLRSLRDVIQEYGLGKVYTNLTSRDVKRAVRAVEQVAEARKALAAARVDARDLLRGGR